MPELIAGKQFTRNLHRLYSEARNFSDSKADIQSAVQKAEFCSMNKDQTIHRGVLLWASFLTLIAAGMGFAIRAGGILGDWEAQFGFTKTELGTITGGGLTGFGIVIILSSLFVDKVGYKPILLVAFLLHVLSAIVTIAATWVYGDDPANKDATYWCLYAGMFMFAIANGLCEAVINPLVATLYPDQKTHYLNLLHAGWPGGLIVGAGLAFLFVGREAAITQLNWEISICLFLVPTLIYGVMVLMQKFPESEASAAGVTFADMLVQFASPMLLFLFLLHAMVGYVELGTDSWITEIMRSVISGKAVLLFIYTSAIMFVLRFFAGPIVERINPVGLLFCSAVLGCLGLLWLSAAQTGLLIILAATVYGVGKTFLWPTMLGVVGERFPRGGAVTMGTIGGIGMLSAGMLGGPAIGFKQDLNASRYLKDKDEAVFEEFVDPKEKSFMMFSTQALDGKKVAEVKDQASKKDATLSDSQQMVLDANIFGGRMALKWTAVVPAMMAVGYLLLLLYFRSKGGYQVEVLHGAKPDGEHYTGGVEGPVE